MLRAGLRIVQHLSNAAGSAADKSTFRLLNGAVGDGPRTHSTSTSRRARRDDHRFFKKEMRTSNHECGPKALGAGPLIIQHLSNVAGSAADRSIILLLGGVVGDEPRAHSTSNSCRAGRGDNRFKKEKKRRGLRIKKADLVFSGPDFG